MDHSQESKLERAFWKFHNNNPIVYELLVRFAREWHQYRDHCSMSLLFERARWAYSIEVNTQDNFKLNNNHKAYYARLILDREPDLCGFFRLRQQTIQCTFGPRNESLPSGAHVA